MWSKTIPTETAHYWVKSKNGWQEIVRGEKDPLAKKKLMFYSVGWEIGQSGEAIIRDGGRFWSDSIPPPELQPTDLMNLDDL